MSGLLLCNKQSDVPYEIKESNTRIYSIEELAYYLYENAYFIDDTFFDQELVDYIEQQLGLPKVAMKLKYALGQKMNFSELILAIVNASQYYNDEEVKALEKELKMIASKSVPERMKTRADKLLENGKLTASMDTYQKILNNNMYKKQDESFYASIYEGLGKSMCRLFQFTNAIKSFKKAYELNDDKMYLEQIIMAKLMESENLEQEADLEEEKLKDEILVDQCKSKYLEAKEAIRTSDEYEQLEKIFVYDGRRNLDDYYEGIQEVLNTWKKDYKEGIA